MLWADGNKGFLREDVVLGFIFVIGFDNKLHVEMLFHSKNRRDTIFTP